MMNVWRQRGAGAAQSDPGKPCFGERDQKEVIHFCTVFMGVDNGVDNGSPPRLPHGHGLFEGGQLGGQWSFFKLIKYN